MANSAPETTQPAEGTEPNFSGTAFCPTCCSTEDIVCRDGDTVDFECTSCGQRWTMPIDAERFATSAPA